MHIVSYLIKMSEENELMWGWCWGVEWDFEVVRRRKLGEYAGIFWQHFPKDIFKGHFNKWKKMQNTRSSYDTTNAFCL